MIFQRPLQKHRDDTRCGSLAIDQVSEHVERRPVLTVGSLSSGVSHGIDPHE